MLYGPGDFVLITNCSDPALILKVGRVISKSWSHDSIKVKIPENPVPAFLICKNLKRISQQEYEVYSILES